LLDNSTWALIKSLALQQVKGAIRECMATECHERLAENSKGADCAESFTAPAAVEHRVWRNSFIVIAISAAAAATLADVKFTLGLLFGGGLALLNYRWLHASLRRALELSASLGIEKAPPGTIMKFALRWLVIAAVAYAANRTGRFDAVGIISGMFAPAAAIMLEAIYVTYKIIAQDLKRG
jgi:hypothetical protein